jgi:hypothetical protein
MERRWSKGPHVLNVRFKVGIRDPGTGLVTNQQLLKRRRPRRKGIEMSYAAGPQSVVDDRASEAGIDTGQISGHCSLGLGPGSGNFLDQEQDSGDGRRAGDARGTQGSCGDGGPAIGWIPPLRPAQEPLRDAATSGSDPHHPGLWSLPYSNAESTIFESHAWEVFSDDFWGFDGDPSFPYLNSWEC